MPDEFPRHSVRDADGFEQGGGRVLKRMKANFVLLTQDVSAYSGLLVFMVLICQEQQFNASAKLA